MKKLIIEAPSGLDPKYKLWAREAAGEMLSLFPEYKSSFQIEFDELCRHGQTEIDQVLLRFQRQLPCLSRRE